MTTPEQLFRSYRDDGDVHALGALFDRIAPELTLVAARLGDARTAEDLVQSTFLDAIEQRDRWDASRPLVPWLVGILSNHVHRARRSRRRNLEADRRGLRTMLEEDERNGPYSSAELTEILQLVQTEVERLPRIYRQILMLRLLDGLTVPAIARRLDTPLGTVKVRLHRGLELLRNALPAAIASLLAVSLLADVGLAAVREAVLTRAGHVPTETTPEEVPHEAPGDVVASGVSATSSAAWIGVVALLLAAFVGWLTHAATGPAAPLPVAARPHQTMAPRPPLSPVGTPGTSLRRTPAAQGASADSRNKVRILVVDDQGAPVPSAVVFQHTEDIDWANVSAATTADLANLGGNCAFDYFRRLGTPMRADSRGRIEVPLTQRLFLAARDGRRAGELALIATAFATDQEQRLVLRDDYDVALRVVDRSGAGLSSVRLRARPTVGGVPLPAIDGSHNNPASYFASGPTGSASLRSVRQWAAGRTGYSREAGRPEVDGCRIEWMIPGAGAPVAYEFAVATPTNEPVTLTAPPTGCIEVAFFDAAGGATNATNVWLQPVAVDAARRVTGRPTGRGTIQFPHVALGRRFRVGATDAPSIVEREVAGPVAAGETVRVDLRESPSAQVRTVTIIDAQQQPVRRALWLVVAYELGAQRVPTATGTDGHLRLEVERLAAHDVAEVAFVAVQSRNQLRGGMDGALLASSSLFGDGPRDLGALELRPMPLLVSGTFCVDGVPNELGLACDGIGVDELRLEYRPAKAGGSWHRLPCQSIEFGPDGRFTARGFAVGGPLRLVVSSRFHRPTGPIEVSPGQVDATVDLVTASKLRIRTELDDGISVRDLHAVLYRETTATTGSTSQPIVGVRDGRGFVWRGLEVGTYRCEVFTAGSGRPIASLSGLETVGDRERAAAVVLDLRGQLERTEVTLLDPQGQPLAAPAWLWNGMSERSAAVPVHGGRGVVLGPALLTVRCSAPGYSTQTLTSRQRSLTVRMQPLQPVRFELPAFDVAAGVAELEVRRDIDTRGMRPWLPGGVDRRMDLPDELGIRRRHRLGSERTIMHAAAPGELLHLRAWLHVDGRRVPLSLAPSQVVCRPDEARARTIRVTLTSPR